MKFHKILLLIISLLLLSSCKQTSEQSPPSLELEEIPARVLISEVYTGEEGNNQADFIELYNAGMQIADLEGYSLWYQLKDGSEEILLASWDEPTLIPPLGYYALVQEGQQFGVLPDRVFNQPLVPSRGGLSLRSGAEIADQVSWGSGPSAMAEGSPAPAMLPGSSLARSIDQETGSCQDSDQNQADFSLNSTPVLQNTGSPINHPAAGALGFKLDFPTLVKPGEEFTASFKVSNHTGLELENIQFELTLPKNITLQENAPVQSEGGRIISTIPTLEDGSTAVVSLPLQGEYTFGDFSLHNLYLQASNWPFPAFAGPFYGEIGGGAIPIATARELIDREVVVQGTSTMYVGGFFAGSGAKFYVEDDSGGIQVYVPGAGSTLVVPLGSTVRVRGKIQPYRDSLELIPSSEDQVEILQAGSQEDYLAPEALSIETLSTQPEDFPGHLVSVTGQIGQVEEFNYSYEIDLFDEKGHLVSIYIDKETGITIEEVQADQDYRVAGIWELFDGNWQLYPRLQSDLARIYAPGLYVQAEPPTTAEVGDPFQVSYRVTNHDTRTDLNLVLRAPVDPHLEVLQISDGGVLENGSIIWEIPQLAGSGTLIRPGYQARITGNPEYVSFADYTIQSENWPEPASGDPTYTFAGKTVPIWAIQGPGDSSPYLRANLTTRGVVTGVFPELEGFWIQETQTDSDPATSPGIFISTGPNLPQVSRGDLVSVTGWVREAFQQTELEISSPVLVEILGSGSLPAPVPLDPPASNDASPAYYESLEGSLVYLPGSAVVVGPSTRYGEFAIVLAKYGVDRSWQNQDHGMVIHVDDGSSLVHNSGDTLPYSLAVGDRVANLVGPLSFTYGNFKIEPTAPYQVQTHLPVLDPLEPLEDGYLRIMTWNVENLFDFVVPHPSSPPLPTVSEYKRDITKVALTIEAAGFPTVIGLQEVENIGILEDIAAEPLLADYSYQPALIEGTDSRGIDVGYLVRGDRAAILDIVQYPAPGNITSRPPLLIKIQVGGEDQTVYLLNNHFTSMGGGEKATEPRRTAQAAWNQEIAQQLLAEHPDAWLVVMGDLNSYYGSLPLLTLQDGGLTNLFDNLEPDERYTYIYEGNSQVLDHILATSSLLDLLTSLDVLHSNADYPLPLSTETDLFHKSDHDPVIATFVIP